MVKTTITCLKKMKNEKIEKAFTIHAQCMQFF